MALEVVGGVVLGTTVGELLKAVLDARQKASAFQPALARLESTLKEMIPRLDQISRLNYQLNLQEPEMEELKTLIINGRALVVKCSKISIINLVKKVQYSKELHDLDNSLLRYFMTILPLDHLKDTKEILVVVKDLQMKLVLDHKDGGVNQIESSGRIKEKDSASVAPEAIMLLQDDSNHELKQKELLAQENDMKIQALEAISSKESISYPDGSEDDKKSTTNPASSTAKSNQGKNEWIDQYKPGVYVYLVALLDGTREIKRVRFSRRVFGDLQAETWWLENRKKVYERYNMSGIMS